MYFLKKLQFEIQIVFNQNILTNNFKIKWKRASCNQIYPGKQLTSSRIFCFYPTTVFLFTFRCLNVNYAFIHWFSMLSTTSTRSVKTKKIVSCFEIFWVIWRSFRNIFKLIISIISFYLHDCAFIFSAPKHLPEKRC